MKANTATNLEYFQVNHYLKIDSEMEVGTKEWYQAILKKGYKYMYMWVNSDKSWYFFAKTEAQARQGAIELYAKEKGYIEKEAKNWYSEEVDIWEVKNWISEIFN